MASCLCAGFSVPNIVCCVYWQAELCIGHLAVSSMCGFRDASSFFPALLRLRSGAAGSFSAFDLASANFCGSSNVADVLANC